MKMEILYEISGICVVVQENEKDRVGVVVLLIDVLFSGMVEFGCIGSSLQCFSCRHLWCSALLREMMKRRGYRIPLIGC